ncbi:Gfo/Idh/MocA family oxidoreductase [Aeoliella sp. ICT_H6.2]|uniref:Gfo/Idh/MocA family oxidoreductase n=1 Tax=Aeoliella straminimaris TaxID=2954799 RepID=A0A9X2F919_9BACT|nr:Gfo/Idh/MocA family oxidoreductase [Aeoliella straminimaris]MCO6044094.1 Gfo/Idh/MocA family oxidoreductase [Aeoliella straminimaris]
MTAIDRRTFVAASGAATLAATTTRAQTDRNNTVRCAVLGVNGRGKVHIDAIENVPGAEVALLCDPDAKVLHQRAGEFERKYGRRVETETDLRRVNDRSDIDVVSIATPNHWHALSSIWACQAGKDVYLEKPGSHNLWEGRKMVEAAHRYHRIVQHGVQLRSNPKLQEAVQLLRDGLIGDVYMARACVFRWRPSIGSQPNSTVPATLDWDMWQGPVAERPFSTRYVHYNWHWHWDYGNGDIGNQGVHETDMALWGLDEGLPTEITAMGGNFLWQDDRETPEVLSAMCRFGDSNKMLEIAVRPWCTNLEQGVGVGNLFYGSKGIMTIDNYNTYKTYLGRRREPGPSGTSGDPLQAHFDNFFTAVRRRDPSELNAPIETGHTSSGIAHLTNISSRLGRQLKFDPQSEKFVGDAEADTMLTRIYRAPYVVPENV